MAAAAAVAWPDWIDPAFMDYPAFSTLQQRMDSFGDNVPFTTRYRLATVGCFQLPDGDLACYVCGLIESNAAEVFQQENPTHVCNALDEYLRFMNDIMERETSFYKFGWAEANPDPRLVAHHGWFLRSDGHVMCCACRNERRGLVKFDHQLNCPFLPIGVDLEPLKPAIVALGLGPIVRRRPYRPKLTLPPRVLQHYAPYDASMSSFNSRLATFEDATNTFHEAADAGFYCDTDSQEVRILVCFHCGVVTKLWDFVINNNPWYIHSMLSPFCEYVLLVKGALAAQRGSKVPKTNPTTMSSSVECRDAALSDFHLCKICLTEPLGATCLPCGHLASCPRCAVVLTNCPICNEKILFLVRTFIS